MTIPIPPDPYSAASSTAASGAAASIIPGAALGASQMTLNTTVLNASTNQPGGVFGYESIPGSNTLVYSLAPQGGTDPYGNTYPTGLQVNSGQLNAVTLTGVSMDSTSVLQGSVFNNGFLAVPSITGGVATSTLHVLNSAGGAVLSYSNGSSTATFSTAGTYSWTAPTNVTTVKVECWGAGAGGGGGSGTQGGEGGGGGEYAAENSLTVVPGNVYQVQVGGGGAGGNTNQAGNSGGDSIFTAPGGNNLVYAFGGQAGFNFQGGSGGIGSSNTTEEPGGAGATASGFLGGNGGGSSGGTSAAGNAGVASTGNTGGAGGSPPTGGGAGSAGGNNASNASNGSSPGGAGGGAGAGAGLGSKVNTYYPGSSISYYGSQHNPPNYFRVVFSSVFQGSNGQGATGDQYGFFTYNYRQMRSDLSGATINSIYLHLTNLGTGQSSGMTTAVGYTTFTGTFGNTFVPGAGTHEAQSTFHVAKNSSGMYNITSWLSSHIASDFTAIIIGPAGSFTTPGNIAAYGYFYGYNASNNGNTPYIQVNYTPAGSTTQTAGNGSDGQVKISYNGSNTLVGAFSPGSGTDVFGNPYNPGSTTVQHTFLTQGSLPAGSSLGGIVAADTNGTTSVVNPSGQSGAVVPAQTDTGTNTVGNTTTPGAISKSYVINANDAQTGTKYVIYVPFSGTMEGQVLNFGILVNGTNTNIVPVGTVLVTAQGHGFVGHAELHMACTSTGSGGNLRAWYNGVASDSTINRGNAPGFTILAGMTGTVAFNTTVANTVSASCFWSVGQTGQTISGATSTFARYGS